MSRVLPILFNTEMVKAILDRKTVTRRVIKPQPESDQIYPLGFCVDGDTRDIGKFMFGTNSCGGRILFVRPPCLPGDILYVRETWCRGSLDGGKKQYYYRADGNEFCCTWRPSIHMPKAAARIWLKVTDVQAERLQDITEEQAKAEGVEDNRGFIHSPDNEYDRIHSAKEHFSQIWDSTIKKPDLTLYGWGANPWVWVIEFEQCEKPQEV